MTGGTIPALIWHNVMAYAHQGVELRALPGLPPPQHAPIVADAGAQGAPAPQQILLTRKGTELWCASSACLTRMRSLPAPAVPSGPLGEVGGAIP